MKTVLHNIALTVLLSTGMVMVSSTTVSAQNRGGNRSSNSSSVSAPTRRAGNSSGNSASSAKADATVQSRRNSMKDPTAGTTVRPVDNNNSGKNNGNMSRPITNNSGNSSANNWPSDNKPNVSSNQNFSNGTTRPADNLSNLRKGENGHRNQGSGYGYSIGGNTRPDAGHVSAPDNHAYTQGHTGSWSNTVTPPTRTTRPADRMRVSRPSMPKNYRPVKSAPRITGVFGITFGTTYYSSLDYLYNRGYEIDGYTGNTVYLRNVNELNFFWNDAVMTYSNDGYLESAQLYYSTSYSDTSRFNRLYSNLSSTYGVPVYYKKTSGRYEASWYGSDSRGYITVVYNYYNGRYYTTLTYAY